MAKFSMLLAGAAFAVAGGMAWADSHEAAGHEGHDMGATDHGDMDTDSPMGRMMGAMDAMMGAMPMESAGSVDADFLLMMIPHHQSAIDMARVQLEQGQDEATRAMAQEIIDAQEAEIAEMRTMLEGMGVEPPAAASE